MQKIKKSLVFFVVLSAFSLSHGSEPGPTEAVIFETGNNNQLTVEIGSLPNGRLLYVKDTPYAGNGNARGNLAEIRRDGEGKVVIEVWPMINGGQPSGTNELIRALMTALKPGDELVFHEGTYQRLLPVENHVGGTAEKPIILRGYGHGQARPLFFNDAGNTNSWELRWSNLEVSYLEFLQNPGGRIRIGGLRKGMVDRNGTTLGQGRVQAVDGYAIANLVENVTFRDCVFRNQSASSYTITTNDTGSEVNNLVLENNTFKDATNSGLYIGEQVGRCPHHGVIIKNNFFDYSGIARPVGGSEVGYTIQTKRGVTGVVLENNMFLGAFGPGIFFYGGIPNYELETTMPSLIRNNIFAGGRNTGILVGGGPITVENNISIGNNANISFHTGYDSYRSQNVWRGIYIFNNFTALATGRVNFSFPTEFTNSDWGPFQGEVRGNVVGEGSEALARATAGLMKFRTRPEGFDAFMNAFNKLASKERAFTEAEVIELLVTHLGIVL